MCYRCVANFGFVSNKRIYKTTAAKGMRKRITYATNRSGKSGRFWAPRAQVKHIAERYGVSLTTLYMRVNVVQPRKPLWVHLTKVERRQTTINALYICHFWCQRLTMRTKLTIDDQLFAKAVALAKPGVEKSELIRECVKAAWNCILNVAAIRKYPKNSKDLVFLA